MTDFCNDIFSEDESVRVHYWDLYNALTPTERAEYDRLVLQNAVGVDHAVRFAELAQIAEDRLV